MTKNQKTIWLSVILFCLAWFAGCRPAELPEVPTTYSGNSSATDNMQEKPLARWITDTRIQGWLSDNVTIDAEVTSKEAYENGLCDWNFDVIEDGAELTEEMLLAKVPREKFAELLEKCFASLDTTMAEIDENDIYITTNFMIYKEKGKLGLEHSLTGFLLSQKYSLNKEEQIVQQTKKFAEGLGISLSERYTSKVMTQEVLAEFQADTPQANSYRKRWTNIVENYQEEIGVGEYHFYQELDGLPIKSANLVFKGEEEDLAADTPETVKEAYTFMSGLRTHGFCTAIIGLTYDNGEVNLKLREQRLIRDACTVRQDVVEVEKMLEQLKELFVQKSSAVTYHIGELELVYDWKMTDEGRFILHPYWYAKYYVPQPDFTYIEWHMTFDGYTGELLCDKVNDGEV